MEHGQYKSVSSAAKAAECKACTRRTKGAISILAALLPPRLLSPTEKGFSAPESGKSCSTSRHRHLAICERSGGGRGSRYGRNSGRSSSGRQDPSRGTFIIHVTGDGQARRLVNAEQKASGFAGDAVLHLRITVTGISRLHERIPPPCAV
jgi:hypothetical protein